MHVRTSVLHTVVRSPCGVIGRYVVKLLLGWAEHPRSWVLGRLQPTEWWETVRQWSEETHITFSWRALSCQAWFTINCHPFVEIGNAAYSTKYACIRLADSKAGCETSQQHVLVLKYRSHLMQSDWNRQLVRHLGLMLSTTERVKLNWYCPNIFLDYFLFMFAFGPAPLTHCPCYYGAILLPCEAYASIKLSLTLCLIMSCMGRLLSEIPLNTTEWPFTAWWRLTDQTNNCPPGWAQATVTGMWSSDSGKTGVSNISISKKYII